DELVDAPSAWRVHAESVLGPGGLLIALQVGEGSCAAGDNELLEGALIEIAADKLELLGRVSPPFAHMRGFEPGAYHLQVIRRHRPDAVGRQHRRRGTDRGGHLLLSSASRTTLVLV